MLLILLPHNMDQYNQKLENDKQHDTFKYHSW